MAILGDIIDLHHKRHHPRLGMVDEFQVVAVITGLLANCEASIEKLGRETDAIEQGASLCHNNVGPSIKDFVSSYTTLPPTSHTSPTPTLPAPPSDTRVKDRTRCQLVTAYSTHILHVLHVLLHGRWDAISMLDDDDDWITSTRFNDCASHAIAASQAVSHILKYDPELTFMPYLFGIYLLHGSFILLLFADRMPSVGPNQSVELACETIVRAHEVCVVTLSTEFQAGQHELACGWVKSNSKRRKTSARCYARHSTACAARAPRIGRSIRRDGERCRCIAGRKVQRVWRYDEH